MKPTTWMPCYVKDLLGDTLHLDNALFGSYWLLICAYWMKRGPLPDDDAQLRMICRCTEATWARTKPVLADFFDVKDGEWRHGKIDQLLTEATEHIQAASERGKTAARARWSDEPEMHTQCTCSAQALPDAMPKQCPSNTCAMLADAPSPSPSPIPLSSPSPSTTPSPAAFKSVMTFMTEVNAIYKRDGRPWNNDEEHLLAEVCRRPKWKAEFEEIKMWMNGLDNPRYGPNSIKKLLADWDSHLDKARRPRQGKPTGKTTIETDLDRLEWEAARL